MVGHRGRGLESAPLNATKCAVMQLPIQLQDASGNQITWRHAIWISSNTGVAPADPQIGQVVALDSGTTTITATTGLISANATIAVIGHRSHPCLDE